MDPQEEMIPMREVKKTSLGETAQRTTRLHYEIPRLPIDATLERKQNSVPLLARFRQQRHRWTRFWDMLRGKRHVEETQDMLLVRLPIAHVIGEDNEATGL